MHPSLYDILLLTVAPLAALLPRGDSSSGFAERQTAKQIVNASTDDDATAAYKVFRIFPGSWRDIEALEKLRAMSDDGNEIDFWLDSHQPGHHADIMVSPKAFPSFYDFLVIHKLSYTITVHDVQRLIYQNEHMLPNPNRTAPSIEAKGRIRRSDVEASEQLASNATVNDGGSPTTPGPLSTVGMGRPYERVGQTKGARYSFGRYTNYATMTRYMRTLEHHYPELVKLIQLGTTHEGRSLEGLKIGYPVKNTTKPSFWIDGNLHAREWASSHTSLFIINQLVSEYGINKEITGYLNTLNFYIVPCANPDGYEYSRSSLKPQIRLWRKNLSPAECTTSSWGETKCCQGVDLNRNFDFHWSKIGSSVNPCSNLYAGKKPFSEPETRAISDFLQNSNHFNKPGSQLQAFITLHTYAQLWIHPFSHEVQSYPADISRMKSIAAQATQRVQSVYGTQYRVGTGADLLTPASGGSDDWAKEKLGVKYVYLLELRPKLELSNGFILKQEELIPTAIETFEGIKTVIEAVLDDVNAISDKHSIPTHTSQSSPPTTKETKLTATLSTTAGSTTPSTLITTTVVPFSGRPQIVKIRHSGSTATRVTVRSGIESVESTTSISTKGINSTAATTTRLYTATEADDGTRGELVAETMPVSAGHSLHRPVVRNSSLRFLKLAGKGPTSTQQPLDTTRTPVICEDKRYSCLFWIKSNADICAKEAQFMGDNCPLSCSLCTVA